MGWTMGPYSLSVPWSRFRAAEEQGVVDCKGQLVLAKKARQRTECVNCCAHLVQLFRADVGTVCEAKVDEAPFAQQVLLSECFSLVGGEREGSANLWPPDRLIFPFLA